MSLDDSAARVAATLEDALDGFPDTDLTAAMRYAVSRGKRLRAHLVIAGGNYARCAKGSSGRCGGSD